jgi:hypothetical protein
MPEPVPSGPASCVRLIRALHPCLLDRASTASSARTAAPRGALHRRPGRRA